MLAVAANDTMPLNSRYFIQAVVPRLTLPIVGGALFYLAWMTVFILLPEEIPAFARAGIWVAAPILTALGFFTGTALFNYFQQLPAQTRARVVVRRMIG